MLTAQRGFYVQTRSLGIYCFAWGTMNSLLRNRQQNAPVIMAILILVTIFFVITTFIRYEETARYLVAVGKSYTYSRSCWHWLNIWQQAWPLTYFLVVAMTFYGNVLNFIWASSLVVRALAYCAENCGSGPTWNPQYMEPTFTLTLYLMLTRYSWL